MMVLSKFVDKLPRLKIMKPTKKDSHSTYYEVSMSQIKQQLHRDLPDTIIWGFNGSYPGPTIEVERGEKVFVRWENNLPDKHILPVDKTVHGATMGTPEVRTVVHLHGGRVEPGSDGYPDAWFTKDFKQTGPRFIKKTYQYDNMQLPCCLWYHDHAIGITRLNIYAGLVGLYIIRDEHEKTLNLPSHQFEIPLVIQDKTLNHDGSLFYPSQPKNKIPNVHPSIIPSFIGNTILINGKIWPFLEVEPRKYRFRILNGSNARYYRIGLDRKQHIYLIGTDGGLIEKPVGLHKIILAPGERVDVIIDFTNSNGKSITMTNNAPYPFPNGDPVAHETTGQMMQFRVSKPLSSIDTSSIPKKLTSISKLKETNAVKSRYLTLNESHDKYNRPFQLLNMMKWDDPISENPFIDTTEIWNFINTTRDTHPIHLHLVQFQILSRRNFDVKHFHKTGQIKYLGDVFPPIPQERGWKDIVNCYPGQITSIIARFAPFTGTYVWHCHVLEHEDYEMMRPYKIIEKPTL